MTKNASLQKTLSQKSNLNISQKDEITRLIDSPDFLDFAQMIEETINDGVTFDELLSSKEILQKALEILRYKK
ncbi:MAG TPA: hypothetical protein VMX55_05510 [candidate division Zixibacteria bacterium]|nr:hypothetical protein [candidate division Zixibacteria bacterium]